MSQVAVWRKVASRMLGFWHHGVLMPDGTVIHFTGKGRHGKSNAKIVRTSFKTFKRDARIVYDVKYTRKERLRPREITRRAESRLGERGYNLMYNNCESFAKWCVTGREYSDQSRTVITGMRRGLEYNRNPISGAVVGGVLGAMFGSLNRPPMIARVA